MAVWEAIQWVLEDASPREAAPGDEAAGDEAAGDAAGRTAAVDAATGDRAQTAEVHVRGEVRLRESTALTAAS